MKNLFLALIGLLFSAMLCAQAPQKFTYQSVIRDSYGELVANAPVGIEISILQGWDNGPVLFSEYHNVTTNENGLATLFIGEGTPTTGKLSEVDWDMGPFFLKSAADPQGGTYYTITGISELASVPFALYSSEADSAAKAAWSKNAEYAYHANKADSAAKAYEAEKAYVADSSGVADYAHNVKSRKRSIVITPGMIAPNTFQNGAALGIAPTSRPCIDLPNSNSNFVEFVMSIPVPSDFDGRDFNLRVLYTSDVNTGDFNLQTAVRGSKIGDDLSNFVGGSGPQIPAPSSPNVLEESVRILNSNGVNANSRLLQIVVRRRADTNMDSSTGTLKILGMVLEYDD